MSKSARAPVSLVHTEKDVKPILAQDIFLCMMYSRNDSALRRVLRSFVAELAGEYPDCTPVTLLVERLPLVGLRALFLLLIIVDHRLRHWAMLYEDKSIVRPQPQKVCRFLRTLRDELIPRWLADERNRARDLVREATVLYIRC